MDCDDEFCANKLADLVYLASSKNLKFCYGGYDVINDKGTQVRRVIPKYKTGYLFQKLLLRYEINMQTILICRKFLTDNKLTFDGSLTYSPDFNMFMKIAAHEDIGVIPRVVAKYRIHGQSLSKKKLMVVSSEVEYTVSYFERYHAAIFDKFRREFKLLRAKRNYYDAIFYVSNDDFISAKKALTPIFYKSLKFGALLLLVFLRVPSSIILRLTRREA